MAKPASVNANHQDRYAGICHICNDVLTRNEVRRVIAENLDRIRERVSMHRALLEAARDDPELIRLYTRV